MDKQTVIFKDLGIMEYKSAWDYQENLLQENVRIKTLLRNTVSQGVGETTDEKRQTRNDRRETTDEKLQTTNYFLICEHLPVYTLGKSGKKEHVLLSDAEMANKQIAFFNTNRGGDITFHGLQQIVGYPILDLEYFGTDIGKYLRNLEELIILTMADYGISGERSPGETGVWIEPGILGKERKVCAIGVRCSRWITMHGFALNVNTDLRYFNNIIPCGISGKQVTSMEKELGRKLEYEDVKESIKKNFERVFDAALK